MKIMLPYKLRRALALGAIAGGALVACNKENTTHDTPIPTRDVELVFDTSFENVELENIKKHADMPDVRYVYMIPQNPGWGTLDESDIHSIRNYLQQRIDINPKKVRGNGYFNFAPGVTSKSDSLWYVQNGWAIKQK